MVVTTKKVPKTYVPNSLSKKDKDLQRKELKRQNLGFSFLFVSGQPCGIISHLRQDFSTLDLSTYL